MSDNLRIVIERDSEAFNTYKVIVPPFIMRAVTGRPIISLSYVPGYHAAFEFANHYKKLAQAKNLNASIGGI
jgi:hypothetical protein